VEFVPDFNFLPLPYCDVILGIDWLESHNPMKVDWLSKWMIVNVNGSVVQLHGMQPYLPEFSLVEMLLVSAQDAPLTKPTILDQIQSLLESFQSTFEEPTTLPPSRSCNHSIPLIPGAQHINIRPYWFPPIMKDEIETQVQDMLQKGLIQNNQSSFLSLVLLVKKNDKTWCFYVDYRHLNALTVKFKYPVPVIDELLDELSGASWFFSFDLRAGFYQILL
jgi:hypothetical protein